MRSSESSPCRSAEQDLVDEIARCLYDPLRFIRLAYPWGEPGTPLEKARGPRPWQVMVAAELGEELRKRAFNGADPVDPVRIAVSSGHGIGKTAWVAWIIHWLMSRRSMSKTTITATTSDQLKSRTWAELAKWVGMSVNRHWFTLSSGRGSMALRQVHHPENWFSIAHTSREENSESFAGQHNVNSTSAYIFDEASGVPDKIWEVAEGGLTDGEPIFIALGNPTKRDGAFFRCFNGQAHRWLRHEIDSRTVDGTNKILHQQWIDDYGIDSDWVRVRVLGKFPRAGSLQFIDSGAVTAAQQRSIAPADYAYAPIVIGVDVARYGNDSSAIYVRQGLAVLEGKRYRGLDLMTTAGLVGQAIVKHKPDATFVDVGAIGAGVVDRLRQLGHDVCEVNFGGKSTTPSCYNKRTEIWSRMRDWLNAGGCIPPADAELAHDLEGPQYAVREDGRIELERKEHMVGRGLESPDSGDALAVTFAEYVVKAAPYELLQRRVASLEQDYDPLAVGAGADSYTSSFDPLGGA